MVTGIDISKYDLGWNPDLASKPIDFIIQRAGYGGYYGTQEKDESFENLYIQVLKIPIRGTYWYYSSHSNWKLQADKFLSITKDKDFQFYCVDYEKSYNTLDGRTIAELSEFVKYN